MSIPLPPAPCPPPHLPADLKALMTAVSPGEVAMRQALAEEEMAQAAAAAAAGGEGDTISTAEADMDLTQVGDDWLVG